MSGLRHVSEPLAELISELTGPVSRWTPARKLALLIAIREGAISAADAMAQHDLSEEELETWARRNAAHGFDGLKSTKLQDLRP